MWFTPEITRATLVVMAILIGAGLAFWRSSQDKQHQTRWLLRRLGWVLFGSALLFPLAAGTLWPVAAILQLADSYFTKPWHTSLDLEAQLVNARDGSPVANHGVEVEAVWQIWLADQRVAFSGRTDAAGNFICREDLTFTCNRVFVVTTDLTGKRIAIEWDGSCPLILQL